MFFKYNCLEGILFIFGPKSLWLHPDPLATPSILIKVKSRKSFFRYYGVVWGTLLFCICIRFPLKRWFKGVPNFAETIGWKQGSSPCLKSLTSHGIVHSEFIACYKKKTIYGLLQQQCHLSTFVLHHSMACKPGKRHLPRRELEWIRSLLDKIPFSKLPTNHVILQRIFHLR